MDRKTFIKSCGVACFGGTVLASALAGCASANYFAVTTVENNKLVINANEFQYVNNEKVEVRDFVLVRTTKHRYPICIYRNADANNAISYNALLMECTHKGCELHANGDYLICPCHGSEFTSKGVVQNPPAEKNLHSFIVTTSSDKIYLHI